MKNILENILGFIYSLSMGDYFFFIGTFLLIVLFVYVLYLIKCSDMEKEDASETKEFDIQKACKQIEKEYKPETIKLTSFEEEQENTAIISYDELVKSRNNITYDDEYNYELPELKVKKFDLTGTGKVPVIDENKLEVKLMNYEKEEEFLLALKKLQASLNN